MPQQTVKNFQHDRQHLAFRLLANRAQVCEIVRLTILNFLCLSRTTNRAITERSAIARLLIGSCPGASKYLFYLRKALKVMVRMPHHHGHCFHDESIRTSRQRPQVRPAGAVTLRCQHGDSGRGVVRPTAFISTLRSMTARSAGPACRSRRGRRPGCVVCCRGSSQVTR